MKLLLTGCAGFIGYHLAINLLDDENEIIGIDNLNNYYNVNLKKDRLERLNKYKNFTFEKIDICHRKPLENVFKKHKPKKVVNLAAQAGVSYSITNPYAYLESNLIGFMNIIELSRNYSVEGLIYASSSSVYGSNSKTPFSTNDRVSKPIALYGATKRANELIPHSYSHLYNLNTTGLRFFTVYGPWYRPDMAMFIFTKKIIENKKIQIYNNGNIKRDFTYIDDIVNGTKLAIDRNYKCEIFNLGNNKSENLMDIVSLIENEIGKEAIIDYKPLRDGDMLETFADISLSENLLNYKPEINISKGIPRLVRWYREYYKC